VRLSHPHHPTAANSALQQHVRELSALLATGLEDPYHELKKAAAAALAALAAKLSPAALEAPAERLLQVLVGGLGHPHSRVRLALLSALDALLASGAVQQSLVESIVVAGVRPLASDRAVAVREAFFAALARWMGADSDPGGSGSGSDSATTNSSSSGPQEDRVTRCRRLAPLLLPFLLLGVSDEAEAAAALALSKLEAVGDVWAAAGGSAAVATADGTADPMQLDGEPPQPSTSSSGVSAAAVAAAALPAPYHGLPRAGACAMGAALLPDLMPPLLRELGEWTIAMRCAAAHCLHALLVLSGPAVTPQLGRLLPALAAAVGDEEAVVASRVAACVCVVGALVPAAHWLPIAADGVSNGKAGNAARTNALVVLAALVHSAGRAQQQLPASSLAALAAALGGDEVLSAAAEHAGARMQLLAAIGALLLCAGPEAGRAAVAPRLYRALLQLYGSSLAEGPSGAAEAAAVREALLQLEAAVDAAAGSAPAAPDTHPDANSLSSSGSSSSRVDRGLLCAAYGVPLLDSLAATTETWCPQSPAFLAFGALLRTAPSAYLAALLPRAVDVLSPVVSNKEGDAALRIEVLRLVDDLMEGESSSEAMWAPGSAAAVLTRIVMPPLAWRAGKVAAAVRFQAVTALATMVRRRLADQGVLQAAVDGGLLPLLHQCLDEDWYPDVRLAAAVVEGGLLEAVGGGLADEQRRAVYVELLKRLDDSNNQVRGGGLLSRGFLRLLDWLKAHRLLLCFPGTLLPTDPLAASLHTTGPHSSVQCTRSLCTLPAPVLLRHQRWLPGGGVGHTHGRPRRRRS